MRAIIATNLKRLRDAAGYLQKDVASFLEIERGAYANFESGTRDIPFCLLEKICTLYGISLSSIFEKDPMIFESELICAFRIEAPIKSDIEEISDFKEMVRDYLKISNY